MSGITYVGIDLSMNSPGVCVIRNSKCDLRAYTRVSKAKSSKMRLEAGDYRARVFSQMYWSCQQERFQRIADFVLDALDEHETCRVAMEGYSYGSRSGRSFEIGELGGFVKSALWSRGIEVEIYAPTEVKKFATGRGNVGKGEMHDAFVELTDLDLSARFGIDKRVSPISDFVDAYWVAALLIENTLTED